MKRRGIEIHLRVCGCELIREGSNHSWWGNPANGKRSAVPRQSEINDLLCRKICRDLGIESPSR